LGFTRARCLLLKLLPRGGAPSLVGRSSCLPVGGGSEF